MLPQRSVFVRRDHVGEVDVVYLFQEMRRGRLVWYVNLLVALLVACNSRFLRCEITWTDLQRVMCLGRRTLATGTAMTSAAKDTIAKRTSCHS